MIRGAIDKDINKIKKLLNRELREFDEGKLKENFKNSNCSLVYENDGEVLGFVVLTIYNEKLKNAEMFLYVAESYRRNGIGQKLYSKVLEYCNKEKLNCICTDIRIEKINTGEFLTSRGFEKRFSFTEMEYEGGKVESDLQVVSYEEKYYEIYKNAFEDAFFDMRKALEMKPYRDCYKPEELMKRKDDIFLLLDNEDIIGAVILADNEVDEFFINEKYQGQGYGRKLLNFSINYYQKRNAEKIFLGVADWNVRGANLYESCGFNRARRYEVYRIDLNK